MLSSRIAFALEAETRTDTAELLNESAPLYVHRVTLINHKLDRSMKLDVTTLTESFCDVLREVSDLRQTYGLTGYTLDPDCEFELLTAPF